ncbi:hypothetical protein WJX82_005983 [Trebouxia sp. C0006]
MSLADVFGPRLSGPSSELIRSPVRLDDLSGVPHFGISPHVPPRTLSWRASISIGRVTNPTGPLSLKAFARYVHVSLAYITCIEGRHQQPLAFPLGFLQYSVKMWCRIEGWGDVYSNVSVGLSVGMQEWNRCACGVVSIGAGTRSTV